MESMKRKNGIAESFLDEFAPSERLQLGILLVGVCLILALTIGGLWQWWMNVSDRLVHDSGLSTGKGTPPLYVAPTMPALLRTQPPAVALADPGFAPPGTRVVSWGGGRISLSDGDEMRSLGIRGTDVVIAPQRGANADAHSDLAYVRDDQLFWLHDGREEVIPTGGKAMMPAWNADGSALLFVSRDAMDDNIQRIEFSADRQTYVVRRMLAVPALAAPPLSHPATGRVLVAEWRAGLPGQTEETIFATIDSTCATQAACERSRTVFATVPYAVNWADYHPGATMLAFSTVDGEGLYLLSTGSGKVQRIDGAMMDARRPTFDTDGKYLIYLDAAGESFVTPLTAPAKRWRLMSAANGNIASIDWVNE